MTASKVLYLLDANVLIEAKNLYYPFDMVPEFWEWLLHQAEQGVIKMPIETYDEVAGGTDPLSVWVSRADVKAALILKEEADAVLVGQVISRGYAADLNDTEVEQVGQDPFLVSYAVASPGDRVVVSNEASKPSLRRANRKVPDICVSVGVTCQKSFVMLRALGFRTGWRAS